MSDILPRKSEILNQNDPNSLPNAPKDRLVIFGKFTNGAFDLFKATQEYLDVNGITDVKVTFVKQERAIDDVFADQDSDFDGGKLLGVVAFPEMRCSYYGPSTDVYTPFEHIEELCREHEVPFAFLRGEVTQFELEEGLGQLASTLAIEQAGTPTQE